MDGESKFQGGGMVDSSAMGMPSQDMKFITRPAVTWTCNNCQKPCVPVRGESRCLCGHRYKQHKAESKGRFKCTVRNCKCRHFFFVVAEGAWILRCRCKHKHTDHDPNPPYLCKKPNCRQCTGFTSPWVCNCGCPWTEHTQSIRAVKYVVVDGREMPASLFAQLAGIENPEGGGQGGIAPEINNVSRDPEFGQRRYN